MIRWLAFFCVLLLWVPSWAQECLSRGASYRVSSSYSSDYAPLDSLLTGQGPLHSARLANNGSVAPEFAFHSGLERAPYIVIDLGKPAWVKGLRISNRRRQCQQRAEGLTAWFSPDGAEWSPPLSLGAVQEDWSEPVVPARLARYVKIGLQRRDYLHLAQVEVLGSAAPGLAAPLLACEVQPGATAQTFAAPQGVRVTVPGNLLSQVTPLRVSEAVGLPGLGEPGWVSGQAYEVRLGELRQLSQEVLIEIPLDPRWSSNRRLVEGVRFDEVRGEWVEVPSQLSADGQRVVLHTRHLCGLMLSIPPPLTLPEADPNQRDRVLYYGDGGEYNVKVSWLDTPAFRAATRSYNSNYAATSSDPTLPPYVKQVLSAAHRAATAYYKLGFRPHSQSLHICVQPGLHSAHSGLTKRITINLAATQEDELAYVVSHEIFHNFQMSDYYLGGTIMRRWWMEATAEYAASRIALSHYRFMGKLENSTALRDLPGCLSRCPLTYAYLHKGWLEGFVDPVAGVQEWQKRHAYRGAFFLDYLCRVGTSLRQQAGEATTPGQEFKRLWDAVVSGGNWDFDVLAPIDEFISRRYTGLNLAKMYSLYAAHFYLHSGSPLPGAQVPDAALSARHRLKAGDPPLELGFVCMDGPRALLQAVTVEADMKVQCSLIDPVPAEGLAQVWLLVCPQGKRESGDLVRSLWQKHQQPLAGTPVNLDLHKQDVIYALGIHLTPLPDNPGDANPLLAAPVLRLQIKGAEQAGGVWRRVGAPKFEVQKNQASPDHILELQASDGQVTASALSGGRELKAALVWPSPAQQVKEEDNLTLTLTPSLSGDVTPQHGLRAQVYAQMLQITPSHRTVAADFNRRLPGPTVFQLKMPRLYSSKPVRLPISVLCQSPCGSANVTYEYEWSPKRP